MFSPSPKVGEWPKAEGVFEALNYEARFDICATAHTLSVISIFASTASPRQHFARDKVPDSVHRSFSEGGRAGEGVPLMTSARFSLRLEPELKEWLEGEAKRQKRSAGFIATSAIEHLKEATEAKRQLIRDAVHKADKGVFVSQGAVHAWMDSWDTANELPTPQADVFLKPRA
jgi:predicted transcriptional regulator